MLAACAFYNGLTLRQYAITSPKIGEAVTLVLISDLHNSRFGKNQKQLIEKITQQHPDLILITGDLVDSIEKTAHAEAFLAGIKGICPVYYVFGNHEYRTFHVQDIRAMVEANGATVLADTAELLEINGNRILIAGVDDPLKRQYMDAAYSQAISMQKAFGGFADAPEFKILLSHRPERIDSYLPYAFDLVVAGHAHGGQVRIPYLLNGLYSPNQGFLPKLAGGRYDFDRTTMVVSRGTSFYPTLPRVFNPPEVVAITLQRRPA